MNRPVVFGGVGEYGRACFYIEVGEYKILLDAGIMKGKGLPDEEIYPLIPESLIPSLDVIWLSHSHSDHTGFLPHLLSGGFQGKIISSWETQKQVLDRTEYPFISEEYNWETLDYPGKAFDWTIQSGDKPPLYGRSGATGHMIGSLWLEISCIEGSFIYTGDMSIESVLYKWDDLQSETKYNWGIIDQGYDAKRPKQTENERKLYATLLRAKNSEKTVVFPLPKYGRSLEILLLLFRYFKDDYLPLYIDLSIYKDVKSAVDQLEWMDKETREEYVKMFAWVQTNAEPVKNWDDERQKDFTLIILADSGLEQKLSKQLLDNLSVHDEVILTGNPGKGSYAETALNQKATEVKPSVRMLPYNVHLTVPESQMIAGRWNVRHPIYFHGKHNQPYLM
ncbi:MAG: MBL fold metallo-hydrolase [Alkalibacterium sp.]|nr:MBL fold metallo-hydrolase [Alkalibacterium sp.]